MIILLKMSAGNHGLSYLKTEKYDRNRAVFGEIRSADTASGVSAEIVFKPAFSFPCHHPYTMNLFNHKLSAVKRRNVITLALNEV